MAVEVQDDGNGHREMGEEVKALSYEKVVLAKIASYPVAKEKCQAGIEEYRVGADDILISLTLMYI